MAAIVLGNEINFHGNGWERSPLLSKKEKPFLEKVPYPLASHLCPAEIWMHCSNLLATTWMKSHWGGCRPERWKQSGSWLISVNSHTSLRPWISNLLPPWEKLTTSVSASVGWLSAVCNWIHFNWDRNPVLSCRKKDLSSIKKAFLLIGALQPWNGLPLSFSLKQLFLPVTPALYPQWVNVPCSCQLVNQVRN